MKTRLQHWFVSFSLLGLFGILACLPGTAFAATANLPQPSAVTFANNNWNCKTAACTSTVQQGQAQPDYQCAEFVARSLAFAEYMPGLSSISSQHDYEFYNPHLGNGRTYDLLAITPGISPTGYDLYNYLLDAGLATNIHQNLSNAVVGDMVVFVNSSGTPVHTALIVVKGSTTSTTKLDAHNNAAYKYALSSMASGFSNWHILHIS